MKGWAILSLFLVFTILSSFNSIQAQENSADAISLKNPFNRSKPQKAKPAPPLRLTPLAITLQKNDFLQGLGNSLKFSTLFAIPGYWEEKLPPAETAFELEFTIRETLGRNVFKSTSQTPLTIFPSGLSKSEFLMHASQGQPGEKSDWIWNSFSKVLQKKGKTLILANSEWDGSITALHQKIREGKFSLQAIGKIIPLTRGKPLAVSGSLITRFRFFPSETEPGFLSFNPDPQTTLSTGEITVTGEVEPSESQVFFRGQEVPVKKGRFSTQVSLQEGDNPLEFEARHKKGKNILKKVNYQFRGKGAVIRFDNIKHGGYYNTRKLKLSGRVDQEMKSFSINGKEVAVKEGAFATELDVPEGEARLLCSGENLAGTPCQMECAVIIDTISPVAKILSPNSGKPTNKPLSLVEYMTLEPNLKSVKITVQPKGQGGSK